MTTDPETTDEAEIEALSIGAAAAAWHRYVGTAAAVDYFRARSNLMAVTPPGLHLAVVAELTSRRGGSWDPAVVDRLCAEVAAGDWPAATDVDVAPPIEAPPGMTAVATPGDTPPPRSRLRLARPRLRLELAEAFDAAAARLRGVQ